MTQPTAPPDVRLPADQREAASKVDLPPIIAITLAVWLMIGPSFIHYPLSAAGENASTRDRGLALLLLLAGVCWARARTQRRRYLALYAVLNVVLVVLAVVVNGLTGELRAAAWNELVCGVLGVLVAGAGWGGAGGARPRPGGGGRGPPPPRRPPTRTRWRTCASREPRSGKLAAVAVI